MKIVNYTTGTMEYHDWLYWKHDNEQPFKYLYPETIKRIKDIPNRDPLKKL